MHVYHASFEYVPRFCRHVPLTLDSWASASTRWHVLTQGVLTPKFCSDLRETENVSFDTPNAPGKRASRFTRSGNYEATAKRCHSPGTPLSS
jgi:hypothetical protein